MRQGPNNRRPRGRHHGGGNGNGGNHGGGGHSNHSNHSSSSSSGMQGSRPRSAASLRHQSFDSNCVDLGVRGNAWQVHEKYQALARDAQGAGDRVSAENYLQHAEHYYRIIQAINEATAAEQRVRGEPVTPPFTGQQPEMPTNYYGSGPAPVTANAEGQPAAAQPMAEATVQSVNQPQPSAFFSQEEIEEHNRDQSVAAAR